LVVRARALTHPPHLPPLFSYPVRLALIDLDNPPPWYAASGQAGAHLTAAAARAAAGTAAGPVWLLTNPWAAGYAQNPISVYYCYADGGGGPPHGGREGGSVKAAIAEVTNTPWGATSSFTFDPAGDTTPKCMHVSPFMGMGNEWRLKAGPPSWRVSVRVAATHPAHGPYFAADLAAVRCVGDGAGARNERAGVGVLLRCGRGGRGRGGGRAPATPSPTPPPSSLLHTSYGYTPHRTAAWIYRQAAALLIKGVPLHGPPPKGSTVGAPTRSRDRRDPDRWRVWRGAVGWPWSAAADGV